MTFPRDCKELRVLGFFRRDTKTCLDKLCVLGYFRRDSREGWKCFKNKVYSIDRGNKILEIGEQVISSVISGQSIFLHLFF